jgi:hypothetical protein
VYSWPPGVFRILLAYYIKWPWFFDRTCERD